MSEVFIQVGGGFEFNFMPVDFAVEKTLFDKLAEKVGVRSLSGPYCGRPNGDSMAFHVP